jgi:hypothetical protein
LQVISTTWLREWINPAVSDEVLAEQLTMAGLEVDGIAPVAPYFENVVVGYVVSCEPLNLLPCLIQILNKSYQMTPHREVWLF